MRKIWSLYINEIIKIKKRVSIIVIMCIMVVLVFALGGIMKLISNVSTSESTYNSISYMTEEQNTVYIDQGISEAQTELDALNLQLTQTTDEAEKQSIQYQIDSYNIEIEYYNLAKENNLDILTGGTGFLEVAAADISAAKGYILDIQYGYSEGTEADIAYAEKAIENDLEILESKDYSLYLELQREYINSSPNLSEEEKLINLEVLNLIEQANPTGETNLNLDYKIQSLMTAETSLLNGVSSTGAVLSTQEKQDLEDSILVMKYEIENGYGISDESSIAGTTIAAMISVGMLLITILVMILAGGALSSELSSGTIKSLIISPTRRWKIYVAKFLSITTIGIVSCLATLIVALISYLIFFGAGEMNPYVYASGGEAHAIPFIIYQLAYTFLSFIDVFIFMVFAFMLSIITRNTAASVGVSIGVYFVGPIVYGILTNFFKSPWMDFIPFANMGIVDRVFTNSAAAAVVGQAGMSSMIDVGVSVPFSLIYFLVLTVIMLWIGFDSFTRKDI